MEVVISVEKLVKQYRTLQAVKGISFDVQKGEIFGLLGENGAGKTTTLEIIEGLRRPTSGKVTVLGHEVGKESAHIKQRIGVQLQSSAYYAYLTLQEMLELFASFYGKKVDPDRLLGMVHLESKAKSYITQLSGGQRQRFSIIASLVNDPEVVFLDEPTTGLDPLARRNLWDLIRSIKDDGRTVVITTHYLEEAEILCDRVAIMEKGEIIAKGKTSELVERAKYPYTIRFEPTQAIETTLHSLEKVATINSLISKGTYEARLETAKNLDTALDCIRASKPEGLQVRPASLEDVFVELTGKNIREEENA